MADVKLRFLVWNDAARPDLQQRKIIRRHVMMGKNRRKRRGEPIASIARPKLSKPFHSPCTEEPSSGEDIASPTALATSLAIPLATGDLAPECSPTIPRAFGYYASGLSFPDFVEPCAVEPVLQFSARAKPMLFPLATCIAFGQESQVWLAPLKSDPAFLHAMIFTSRAFWEVLVSKRLQVTLTTEAHLQRVLQLLRERISDESDFSRFSDTTLATIIVIAGHALIDGDHASALHHLHGARKILRLRGGIKSLWQNRKLLIEILRCDLGLALRRGSSPIFLADVKDEGVFDYSPPATFIDRQEVHADLDPLASERCAELSLAWKIMAELCTTVDSVANNEKYLDLDTVSNTMVAVIYRLISLQFLPTSRNEASRLGLLAFATTVFLQWRSFGLSYDHFVHELQDCVAGLDTTAMSPEFLLWLLMVGADTGLDFVGAPQLLHMLADIMEVCGVDSWDAMKDLLRSSVMWIDMLPSTAARLAMAAAGRARNDSRSSKA